MSYQADQDHVVYAESYTSTYERLRSVPAIIRIACLVKIKFNTIINNKNFFYQFTESWRFFLPGL